VKNTKNDKMSSNNLKCSKRRDAFLAATVKNTVSKDMTQMPILCDTPFQHIEVIDKNLVKTRSG
jgi:hypothetical protein